MFAVFTGLISQHLKDWAAAEESYRLHLVLAQGANNDFEIHVAYTNLVQVRLIQLTCTSAIVNFKGLGINFKRVFHAMFQLENLPLTQMGRCGSCDALYTNIMLLVVCHCISDGHPTVFSELHLMRFRHESARGKPRPKS